ncbi:MAG: universal stress protein [Myxococcales bacterium]|nr:universal stress protein [Myxococcales bacterium]
MAEIRKILIPVDFSPPSTHAADYGVDLAQKLGADVDFVHAYQLPIYALPDGGVMVGPDFVNRLTESAQRSLDQLVARYEGRGLKIGTHLVDGAPHLEVRRLSGEIGADMIVMGTHGRSGVRHFLLGSVAERVVRISEIPVITVRLSD